MGKSRRLLIMLLVFVMSLSLVLSACGNKEKSKEEPKENVTEAGKEEAEAEVAEDGEKVLRLSGMDINTLNNHTASSVGDSAAQAYVTGQLLDYVYNKETGKAEFVGNHAEDLPETEDNIVWTIKLKDNLKWDDEAKTPITAETYEYSWKKLLDPKLVNRNAMMFTENTLVKNAKEYLEGKVEWEEVGIKALDGNTIEITLVDETPTIDVLSVLSSVSLGPVYEKFYEGGMNADGTETDYGTTLDKFVSSGTYRLDEWVRDQIRRYSKIEDSPQAAIYTPEKIVERVVTENSTRLQLFENDEIDVVSLLTEYERFKEDPRVVFSKANFVWGYFINTESETNPILKDKDFRQALFFGLDRDAIAKGVYKTYESTPWYVTSTAMVDWKTGESYAETEQAKSVRPEGTGFEPEKAKELFDKAYAANGNKKVTLELIYFEGQDDMKKMSEVVKEQYENLFGSDRIELKLRSMEFQAAYSAYQQKDFDLGIGANEQSIFNPWSNMKIWSSDFPTKNNTFYNEEFDELYRRTTTGDLKLTTDERIEALKEMEKMLIDYVPQIPVFQNNNALMYSDRIDLITDGEFIPGVGFAPLQADIEGISVQ